MRNIRIFNQSMTFQPFPSNIKILLSF